jgi:acetolactate synthase-1/2/3 large subunit
MSRVNWARAEDRQAKKDVILTGGEAFVESLKAEGVEVIFGYPGGAVLPIYDVLYSSDIRHILVRHEQGAAFMAEGYARSTGKPGVCLATSGPGATNLVTGIANAYMDSIPVVYFTGNVASNLIGSDAFQEADITGITLPITKHNFLVRDANELPKIIRQAFHIATKGRPGPVLVDLPKDITMTKVRFDYPDEVDIPGFKPTYKGHIRQINEAARAIEKAERPVLYVGGGVIAAGAHEEIFDLATKMEIPVTTTLMGLGAFPVEHPLSLGMLGMHGTVYANMAVDQCDLLIACGARFDDRVTGDTSQFALNSKVIHIDIDPAEIGKNKPADIPIVGDVKCVLAELLEKVNEKRNSEWLKRINELKAQYPLRYYPIDNEILPQQAIEAVGEITEGEAIYVSDVGQHQMWVTQYIKFKKPRTHLSSGGLGSMGFGFPSSIGAAVGNPGTKVWLITGDGGFQMNIQELATVSNYNIPLKIALMNNSNLGMVRQWQAMFFGQRYSQTVLQGNPDFVKVAEAYGIPGLKVTDPKELKEAIKKADAHNGPFLLEIKVNADEKVLPMIPAGKSVEHTLGHKGRLE